MVVLALTWKTFVADGRAAKNPWTGIQRKEKDTHTKCELSPEQLDALFNATSGEMRTLFFVGIYTGLRLKDCALLKWDAVDLAGGFIRLIPEKTKRHKIAVSIPILPPLAEALRAARESGDAGGVQSIVGHTNAAMTAQYTHTNEADLSAAMAAFPEIAKAAAEKPAERAATVAVAEIPAEATDAAETRLAVLARLVAEMDADEIEEAARVVEARRKMLDTIPY